MLDSQAQKDLIGSTDQGVGGMARGSYCLVGGCDAYQDGAQDPSTQEVLQKW